MSMPKNFCLYYLQYYYVYIFTCKWISQHVVIVFFKAFHGDLRGLNCESGFAHGIPFQFPSSFCVLPCPFHVRLLIHKKSPSPLSLWWLARAKLFYLFFVLEIFHLLPLEKRYFQELGNFLWSYSHPNIIYTSEMLFHCYLAIGFSVDNEPITHIHFDFEHSMFLGPSALQILSNSVEEIDQDLPWDEFRNVYCVRVFFNILN